MNDTQLQQLCEDLTALNQNTRDLLASFDGLNNAPQEAKRAVQEALSSLSTQIESKLSEATTTANTLKTSTEATMQRNAEKIKATLPEDINGFDYKARANPEPTTNPAKPYAIWLNVTSLEIFVCVDNTENNNIWLGNNSSVVGSSIELQEPGELGFGVGVAPVEVVRACQLNEMVGTTTPGHANYGNYTDKSGSVMVWIPKMYVKYSHATGAPYFGMKVEVSKTLKEGFAVPLCFINAGAEINGLFVDKYLCSFESGLPVSKRNRKALSTHANHNPQSQLSGIQNRYDYSFSAAKLRGQKYCIPHIALYTYLAALAQAHYQATFLSTDGFLHKDYSACAWADIAPYMPKGLDSGATLKSADDPSLVWEHDGYIHPDNGYKFGLTGSVSDSVFAKTTHNGQKCGVADFVGNLWQIAAGVICNSSRQFMTLKKIIDIRTLNYSTAWNYANYDPFIPLVDINDKFSRFGNGEECLFTGATDINSREYINDQLGLPKGDNATSSKGEMRYGCDGLWAYHPADMCPIVNGSLWNAFATGAFTRYFDSARGSADVIVGFRTCLVP